MKEVDVIRRPIIDEVTGIRRPEAYGPFQTDKLRFSCFGCLDNVVEFIIDLLDMYWTFQMATQLDDAPWPASKDQLIDYAERSGLSMEVIENLRELEDDDEEYGSIVEIWPEYIDWSGPEYFGDED